MSKQYELVVIGAGTAAMVAANLFLQVVAKSFAVGARKRTVD